jgi:hypothetical protein
MAQRFRDDRMMIAANPTSAAQQKWKPVLPPVALKM